MFNFSSLMITKFFYLLALSLRNEISSVRRLLVDIIQDMCMYNVWVNLCFIVIGYYEIHFLNHFPRFFSRNLLPVSQLDISLFFVLFFLQVIRNPSAVEKWSQLNGGIYLPFPHYGSFYKQDLWSFRLFCSY